MSKLLEKLGITPEWFGVFSLICNKLSTSKNGVLFKMEDDCTDADFKAALAAPEMLEALIEIQEYLPNLSSFPKKTETGMGNSVKKTIKAIEKATGKTWDEIKELI